MRDIRRFAYDGFEVEEGRIIHLDTLVVKERLEDDDWDILEIPNNELKRMDILKLIREADIRDYSKRDIPYNMYDECKCCEDNFAIFTVDIVFKEAEDKKPFPKEFAKDTYTKVKNMFYLIFSRDYIYDYAELTDFAVNIRDIFDFVYVDNREVIIDFIQDAIDEVRERYEYYKMDYEESKRDEEEEEEEKDENPVLCSWISGIEIERWDGRKEKYDIKEGELEEKFPERELFNLLKKARLGVYKFNKEKHDRHVETITHSYRVTCGKMYYESMKRVLCIILTHCEKIDYYYLIQTVRDFINELDRGRGFGVGMFMNLEKEIIKRLAKDGGLIRG
ncbi:hypothetical protein M1N68_01425 [Peptococcaceae bacterium]|nr:hypothetical protein [Peptococcaceae bacterium]